MKEITIPKEIEIYGETYKVNQGLTKKLNMPGWVVYKEPGLGLWGYNKELNFIVSLMCKNLSLNNPMLDKIIEHWREYITKIEMEKRNSEATEN